MEKYKNKIFPNVRLSKLQDYTKKERESERAQEKSDDEEGEWKKRMFMNCQLIMNYIKLFWRFRALDY